VLDPPHGAKISTAMSQVVDVRSSATHPQRPPSRRLILIVGMRAASDGLALLRSVSD
jgi:hypothetical protein